MKVVGIVAEQRMKHVQDVTLPVTVAVFASINIGTFTTGIVAGVVVWDQSHQVQHDPYHLDHTFLVKVFQLIQ